MYDYQENTNKIHVYNMQKERELYSHGDQFVFSAAFDQSSSKQKKIAPQRHHASVNRQFVAIEESRKLYIFRGPQLDFFATGVCGHKTPHMASRSSRKTLDVVLAEEKILDMMAPPVPMWIHTGCGKCSKAKSPTRGEILVGLSGPVGLNNVPQHLFS